MRIIIIYYYLLVMQKHRSIAGIVQVHLSLICNDPLSLSSYKIRFCFF